MVLAGDDGEHFLAADIGVDDGFRAQRLGEADLGRDAVLALAEGDVLWADADGEAGAGRHAAFERQGKGVAAVDRDLGRGTLDGLDRA